jgi:hypothetical protein
LTVPEEVHGIIKFAIDAGLSATNIVLALSPALRNLQDTPATARDLTRVEVDTLIPVLAHTIADLTDALETVVADDQDRVHPEKERLVHGGIRLLRQGETAIRAAETLHGPRACTPSCSQELALPDFPGGSLAGTLAGSTWEHPVQQGYGVAPSPVAVMDDDAELPADLGADDDVIHPEEAEVRLAVAAVAAYRFSVEAGKPLSQRKLAEMFGKTHWWARSRIAEARKAAMSGPVRQVAGPTPPGNGSQRALHWPELKSILPPASKPPVGKVAPPGGDDNHYGQLVVAATRIVAEAVDNGRRLSQTALAKELRSQGYSFAKDRLPWLVSACGLDPRHGLAAGQEFTGAPGASSPARPGRRPAGTTPSPVTQARPRGRQ